MRRVVARYQLTMLDVVAAIGQWLQRKDPATYAGLGNWEIQVSFKVRGGIIERQNIEALITTAEPSANSEQEAS